MLSLFNHSVVIPLPLPLLRKRQRELLPSPTCGRGSGERAAAPDFRLENKVYSLKSKPLKSSVLPEGALKAHAC